jgi:hypothetical protein
MEDRRLAEEPLVEDGYAPPPLEADAVPQAHVNRGALGKILDVDPIRIRRVELSATITRRDGTVEDVGVLAATDYQ